MNKTKVELTDVLGKRRSLKIGFIPDGDCAPIIVAHETGLFDKYELSVELQRETSWSRIRDSIIYGELDAAHVPATLPFITNIGIDSDQCACVTGMILSLQGNAITVSQELWGESVRDGATLRDLVYRHWGRRTFTFGVEFPYSPAYFLLSQWLKSGGVLPHTEVRIVVIPPAQMFPTLKLGYLDGYCVGEPWTSLAVEAKVGACVATSADLAPMHPEKVLMVRRDFAQDRAQKHERLIAALLEACAFCDQPKNHPLLGEMLARPRYVNAPADCLKRSLTKSSGSPGAENSCAHGLHIFHRNNANDPTNAKAAWLLNRLYELMDQSILKLPPPSRTPVLKNIFRRDIFERAKALLRDQAQALNAEAEGWQANFG
jgi:ABC-type nitrate/sulfonate/bicarbonate transport system substrate-binding protein